MSKRFDYEKKVNDKICLLILEKKLKNIDVIVINLIFVIMRDFEKALTEYTKSIFDTLFFKKINEKNVKEFFNVEKNDLFYNIVT